MATDYAKLLHPAKEKTMTSEEITTREYWTVENTGWSGGVGWYRDYFRFDTLTEAEEHAAKKQKALNCSDILWRVVKTVVERGESWESITRTWRQL